MSSRSWLGSLWSLLALTAASSPQTRSSQHHVKKGYDFYEVELDPSKHDLEFFSFVTRPDIEAPRWDVSVYNESAVAPGYWFLAPYILVEHLDDQAYIGPHIYDGYGDLVWSGAPIFKGFAGFDFKVSDVGTEKILSMIWLRKNSAVLVDDHYNTLQTIDIAVNAGANIHDFQTVDNGTRALFVTHERKNATEADSLTVGYEGRCVAMFTGFDERDVFTGELLFRWSPEGRIGLDESVMERLPEECSANMPWDYLHANSIEKLPDGDYLMSAHRSYAIYKISRQTGEVLWRLGGKRSNFHWIGDGLFAGQHDARCHMQNDTHMTLSILDNANGPGQPRISNDHSRGLLIELRLDASPMTARIMASYDHPHESYAPARGNFQVLPNGNAFVCWSIDALQSEYTPNGDLIMEAKLPSELKTYRSYKFPWVGRPERPPDVHAVVVGSGRTSTTVVHASWNGATEVKSWLLYRSDANGNASVLIAAEQRRGFETALVYQDYAEHIFVEALAGNGTRIGRSFVIQAKRSASVLHPAIAQEIAKIQDLSRHNVNADDSLVDQVVFTLSGAVLLCLVVGLLGAAAYHLWRHVLYRYRRQRQSYAVLSTVEDEEI